MPGCPGAPVQRQLRLPGWWGWVAETCLLPWIGPGLACLTAWGDDVLGMLLGITVWPVFYVLWGIHLVRKREKQVQDANPFPAVPPALLTYSVLAKGSLVLYFLTMIMTTVMVMLAGKEIDPRGLVFLGAAIAGVFLLYILANAVAFHRLRRAVRLVNLMLGAVQSAAENT